MLSAKQVGLPCSASNAAVSFIHSQIPELDLKSFTAVSPKKLLHWHLKDHFEVWLGSNIGQGASMGWLQALCALESGGAKSFDTQQLSLLSINFRDSLRFVHPLHHPGSCPTAKAAWLHSSIHGEDASLLELSCGSKSITCE